MDTLSILGEISLRFGSTQNEIAAQIAEKKPKMCLLARQRSPRSLQPGEPSGRTLPKDLNLAQDMFTSPFCRMDVGATEAMQVSKDKKMEKQWHCA